MELKFHWDLHLPFHLQEIRYLPYVPRVGETVCMKVKHNPKETVTGNVFARGRVVSVDWDTEGIPHLYLKDLEIVVPEGDMTYVPLKL